MFSVNLPRAVHTQFCSAWGSMEDINPSEDGFLFLGRNVQKQSEISFARWLTVCAAVANSWGVSWSGAHNVTVVPVDKIMFCFCPAICNWAILFDFSIIVSDVGGFIERIKSVGTSASASANVIVVVDWCLMLDAETVWWWRRRRRRRNVDWCLIFAAPRPIVVGWSAGGWW